MPVSINSVKLQQEVLALLQELLHGIRKDRNIEDRFPSLRLTLTEMKEEIKALSPLQAKTHTLFQLRKQIPLLDLSLKNRVKRAHGMYELSFGKSARTVFPVRYHKSAVEYYEASLVVIKTFSSEIDDLNKTINSVWSLKEFEDELSQLKVLSAMKTTSALEQENRKTLLGYRDMLRALQVVVRKVW